jgi:murein DD-endopeptidase MepM/ murein hydrolase activator NlpD
MVYMPPGYKLVAAKKKKFNSKYADIVLYARRFSQGNAVYVEINPHGKKNEKLEVKSFSFDNKRVPLTEKKWGHRGFFGISPRGRTGKRKIVLECVYDNKPLTLAYRVTIKRTWFPVYKRALDLGKYSDARKRTPEEIRHIKESKVKKKAAFRHKGKDLLTGILSHPRDMHYITSPFWSKRVYMRYKKRKGKKIRLKNTSSTHRGLDLRGETGTPVYSMADGEVVLADYLYYEGNMVIIDHGNGIFTYFMHMNDVSVKKNEIVKAGSLIGHVGSTGSSTAAHLHVSLYIRGAQVDPLSLLPLPVRD